MNLQLANTISDISGVSGQAIIHAILQGERDPYMLADLSDPHIQASREEIARSLEGTWREDLLFELRQAVDSYQFAQGQIQQCDRKLQTYLAALPSRSLEPPAADSPRPAPPKSGRKCRKRSNEPLLMGLQTELQRICGVDLTSIDGISTISALTILSEIGTDVSGFPDEDHFASWLGLAGNHNITGGKPVKGPKRKVKNRVAEVLRMGAASLLGSDTYLGARYRHLRRNAKLRAVAVKAMARYLAVLVYRLLSKGPPGTGARTRLSTGADGCGELTSTNWPTPNPPSGSHTPGAPILLRRSYCSGPKTPGRTQKQGLPYAPR
jgi:transposase